MGTTDTLTALRAAVQHMRDVGHELDERESQCVLTVVELFEQLDRALVDGNPGPDQWLPARAGTLSEWYQRGLRDAMAARGQAPPPRRENDV